VGWLLREQYRYLDNFIEEIASGKLSEGQIRARARMYIDAAHEAFERARSEAFGLPLMPAYPGDGQSRCLTKCRCNWRHEEVREHGKLTGWRSTWQLNPADHCDDCVSNAKLWAPLIVPAGMSTKEAEAWRKKEQSRMLGKR
jgi:hypothetical protein